MEIRVILLHNNAKMRARASKTRSLAYMMPTALHMCERVGGKIKQSRAPLTSTHDGWHSCYAFPRHLSIKSRETRTKNSSLLLEKKPEIVNSRTKTTKMRPTWGHKEWGQVEHRFENFSETKALEASGPNHAWSTNKVPSNF